MLRVLIVEDDALIAADLEDVVADAGHLVLGPVDSVCRARAAVACCDAALLDANVTDGTTFELAAALQRAGRPFVFVTALTASDLPIGLCGVRLLRKPYRIADIRNWLARLGETAALSAVGFAGGPTSTLYPAE